MSEEIKIDVSKKVKKKVCKEVKKEVKKEVRKEVKNKLNITIPNRKIYDFDEYYTKEKPQLKHNEYTIYN